MEIRKSNLDRLRTNNTIEIQLDKENDHLRSMVILRDAEILYLKKELSKAKFVEPPKKNICACWDRQLIKDCGYRWCFKCGNDLEVILYIWV